MPDKLPPGKRSGKASPLSRPPRPRQNRPRRIPLGSPDWGRDTLICMRGLIAQA